MSEIRKEYTLDCPTCKKEFKFSYPNMEFETKCTNDNCKGNYIMSLDDNEQPFVYSKWPMYKGKLKGIIFIIVALFLVFTKYVLFPDSTLLFTLLGLELNIRVLIALIAVYAFIKATLTTGSFLYLKNSGKYIWSRYGISLLFNCFFAVIFLSSTSELVEIGTDVLATYNENYTVETVEIVTVRDKHEELMFGEIQAKYGEVYTVTEEDYENFKEDTKYKLSYLPYTKMVMDFEEAK